MCQAGRRRVRSKYCAAWAASHKHQGYSTCYGTALACQQDLDRTPPVTGPCSATVPVLQQKREIFPTSRTEYLVVRSKYCATWAASHKHQGYSTCYGTALACQQDLDSTPPVTVPCSATVPVLQQKREIFLTSRTEYVAQKGSGRFCSMYRSVLFGTSYAEQRE